MCELSTYEIRTRLKVVSVSSISPVNFGKGIDTLGLITLRNAVNPLVGLVLIIETIYVFVVTMGLVNFDEVLIFRKVCRVGSFLGKHRELPCFAIVDLTPFGQRPVGLHGPIGTGNGTGIETKVEVRVRLGFHPWYDMRTRVTTVVVVVWSVIWTGVLSGVVVGVGV